MRRLLILALILLASATVSARQKTTTDTVRVGFYITSIHNIDFKQSEYTVTFWLWLKYKNPKLDFINNLEVPDAKSVERAFSTIDSSKGRIYLQMKLQCVMKDSWKIDNFPFDEQKLRINLENSQFDANSVVFIADTLGEHFDQPYTLRGWNIDSCVITSGKRIYRTAFGSEIASSQEIVYSAFNVRLSITRNSGGLFWKMFLGMYMAFMIAFICFYIHSDSMDSRFQLSVGALFAVIGNKYIIDSSLPESSSFTLVDALHGLTLMYILFVVAANAYSLRLVKRDMEEKAIRMDNIIALVLLISYIILNTVLIIRAMNQDQ